MITTFKQRERREGIVLKQIQIPDPGRGSRRGRAALRGSDHPEDAHDSGVPHDQSDGSDPARSPSLRRWRGRHGLPLVIDGAHSLAHFDFDLGELDVDTYTSSLHKWLFAPHGTGFLYVRREMIPEVWPLMAAPEAREQRHSEVRRDRNAPGSAPYLCIGEALSFHEGHRARPERLHASFICVITGRTRCSSTTTSGCNTSQKPGFACAASPTSKWSASNRTTCSDYLWDQAPDHHGEHQPRRVPRAPHQPERVYDDSRARSIHRRDERNRAKRAVRLIAPQMRQSQGRPDRARRRAAAGGRGARHGPGSGSGRDRRALAARLARHAAAWLLCRTSSQTTLTAQAPFPRRGGPLVLLRVRSRLSTGTATRSRWLENREGVRNVWVAAGPSSGRDAPSHHFETTTAKRLRALTFTPDRASASSTRSRRRAESPGRGPRPALHDG